VLPELVGSQYGANIQILRNEFDGGWDGVTLQPDFRNEVDDSIVLKDASNALVKNNYIRNNYDAGIEWAGRLDNPVIQANVIVNTGYTAIGGWYWGSLSDGRFVQNLSDRTSALFRAFRVYGLRPANYDSSWVVGLPADTGVYFRNNLFDGNVLRGQRSTTFWGGDSGNSSWMPLFDRMSYSGSISNLPGEVVPTDAQFDLTNNKFVRNDFGHAYPGPYFGAVPVAGEVIDGGENICLPIDANFPLACN
jgi:parallel beta-helix repeat protein